MNKMFFRLAFLACFTATGCASPFSLFAKKPQSFDDYKTEQIAKNQARVPSSGSLSRGSGETTELLSKAHSAFQQGLMSEAQANYQAVLRKQPNHPEANHRLAVIADRQNDFLTAERYYQAALVTAPRDANTLNDLGYSYLLQSRYAEAERYLTAALQQSPNQANAMNNLGMLHAKRGQVDQALAMFRRTSSEAEAQAKLARYLPPNFNPANPNSAVPPNTMLANNQPWQNNGAPPMNSPVNSQQYPAQQQYPSQQIPSQQIPSQQRLPINANPAYAQGQSPTNSPSAVISDPNISEPARQLKEAMERKRLEAVAERQQRDESERQRQASLMRQLREEELGRSGVTQAGGPQPGGFNRGSQIPNNVPNGPIVIGPATANSNSPNNINSYNNINALPASRPAPTSPSGERTGMADGFPAAPQSADDPLFNVNGNINAKNTLSGSQNWNVPNPAQQVLPQGFPNQNVVSPLDAMPNWPPANSTPSSVPTNTLPSINPNPSLTRNNFQPFVPPNGAWPQGSSSNTNTADDAARAASRMGMNAGPGNPFPITPGPSANAPNSFGPNSSAPSSFGPNSLGPNNGGNFNQRPLGPAPGEPPSGSFGPGGYDTSAKPPTMPESPAQFALRDRLPPSEQYQTPASFNAFGSNNSIAPRPSNFAPSRGIPNPNVNPQAQSTRDLIAEMERASARSTPDRAGGDDRWEQGSAPNGLNTTVPTMQGFLATQSGDNSLAEYERMNQLHNAERNLIQQQLDSQRQLPGSENYFRSSTQSQLGSSTNTDTRLGPTSFSRRSNFNPMSSNNAPRQMP